jgi:4-hydroxybenzoate polyprenyltransferase
MTGARRRPPAPQAITKPTKDEPMPSTLTTRRALLALAAALAAAGPAAAQAPSRTSR